MQTTANRPVIDQSPAQQTTANRPASDQTPDRPKLVEVELVKKYCPFFLVQDGEITPNESRVKENILPGIVLLHPKDAQIALKAQAAMPTHNTFKDL